MKLPLDYIESPLVDSLKWFSSKSPSDILKCRELRFKIDLKDHVFKVVTRLNKSFHEKVNAWLYLNPCKESFGLLFKAAIRLALSDQSEFDLSLNDRFQLLTFFNYSFNSIEVDFVNNQIKRYLPLSIWINLSKNRRELELSRLSKRIQIAWKKLEEQDQRLDTHVLDEKTFERKFMFNYVKQFFLILSNIFIDVTENDETSKEQQLELRRDVALYCQRFVEFIIDIESQLPLRRFFHAILDHTNFIVRCQLSDLARHKSPEGHLFDQLIELLSLYFRYEIDLMSGEPLTDVEIYRKHESDIISLQMVLWSKYEHLRSYSTKPIKAIDNPSALYKIITSFDSKEDLFGFLQTLNLVDEDNMTNEDRENAPLMASILMNRYRRYESQLKKINSIPLFPDESVIWDTNLVPDQYYNYECPLALPKLNLQFLTMSDYLLRNFILFKNESTYEIRQDLEDGILRSKCRWTSEGNFATGPKQRMALIIKDFTIFHVDEPKLGESCPSKVRAKVVINMDFVKPGWRREWEQLRKHDSCFLISFFNPSDTDSFGWPDGTFPGRNGIKYVRGCEIEGILDSEGKIVEEHVKQPEFADNLRTYLVWLDCNQYQIDKGASSDKMRSVYDKFHLMVRRKPEKNNFKGVLDTIKTLINTKFVVPDWLKNLLIGFGDPSDAHHSNLKDELGNVVLDYKDTFLDFQHLIESFGEIMPDHQVCISEEALSKKMELKPPFKITIDDREKKLIVTPYKIPSRGPYLSVMPRKNSVRFTPAQVDAITSGLQKGLTMVVGPPGTGKTDVAVQILSTLYHSFPNQRTLIVTHSNQALNQIFEKIIELDVEEHHIMRLGHGEEDLQSTKDFSRQGRVKHVLAKKLDLLHQVEKLACSLNLDPGRGFTCESAEYFHFYHILSRWEEYIDCIKTTEKVSDLVDKFPFIKFFEDAPQPLFKGQSVHEDFEIAKGCYRYIGRIFDQLQSFRPFEIFHSGKHRSQYLSIREAKIIAMTCTHAGLRRKELVEMNFQYDNILMEETAQILEVETVIPLLLQNPEKGVNRLKRWIMIGDHHQLPPIIQNSAFQKFSNMEQSLFYRFVRLGVPTIELDAQGRSRPTLCDLYRWRYKNLRELSHIDTMPEYRKANAGFIYDYQMIDVCGFGETSPMPHYYQNQAEAEYVIVVYKYMRMIGYPSEKITILTTYNGQRDLLHGLVEQLITEDANLGRPSQVTTVDKYQGQQNDYILLSLVRTKTVGHLRDIRRLVVAMSRARLGLYVFARFGIFKTCFELQYSMNLFKQRPQILCLALDDIKWPSERSLEEQSTSSKQKVQIGSSQELEDLIKKMSLK